MYQLPIPFLSFPDPLLWRTRRHSRRNGKERNYGGLHCGETFDVMVGGRWKPTRIEYGANWYLVGIRADDLSGLRVRI